MSTNIARAIEKQMRLADQALLDKWAFMLDANENAGKLASDTDRWVTAKLLENAYLNPHGGSDLFETPVPTTASGTITFPSGSFNSLPFILGTVRKTTPRLIAGIIAGIQPLSSPVGMIYTLNRTRDDLSDLDDHATWATSRTYADHSAGENGAIAKGMRINLTSATVTADQTKKLLLPWSLESQQDLRATHGLDAGEVLRQAAVDELTREIDGVLVQAAYAAATAHYTVTYGKIAPSGYTAEEWRKRLQRAILLADDKIYTDTGQNATFLICGVNAAMELKDLNEFRVSGVTDGSDVGSLAGERLGTINTGAGEYTVIRSRYVPTNEIIVGRKGDNILDAGLFYLPYVPLYITEPQLDVETQTFRRSLMTRYTTYVASNKFFSRVVIDAAATGIA